MARCHRIGQTRPVVIYKLCTKGTIDEAIVKRAEAKRILEKMVMSKELYKLNIHNKETLMELKQLLESKESKIVSSTKEGNFLYFFLYSALYRDMYNIIQSYIYKSEFL